MRKKAQKEVSDLLLLLLFDSFRRQRIERRNGILAQNIETPVTKPVPVGIAIGILFDGLEDTVSVLHKTVIQLFGGYHHLACILIDSVIVIHDDERIDDLLFPVTECSGKLSHFRDAGMIKASGAVSNVLSL